MNTKFDVIVIGVGGMGSSTCHSLAKRGLRVLGLEQFSLAHDRGSSHGQLRLIRQAYFEHSDYVPLLRKAYEHWESLSQDSGRRLFHRTGLVMIGPSESKILEGVRRSSKLYQIPLEEHGHPDLKRKFPAFRFSENFAGSFEPGAGYLEVENCVKAFSQISQQAGAQLHFDENVLSWEAGGSTVSVKTDHDTYEASKLVITAGPWTSRLLNELRIPLEVRRVPQFWFRSRVPEKSLGALPCYAFDLPSGFFYGFPEINGLVKIAAHTPGEKVPDPSKLDREIHNQDFAALSDCIAKHFPSMNSRPEYGTACMYTLTPDENFVIDLHPQHPNVSFAGGFSGHGFKFASVIGPILADLALTGSTSEPIDFLRLRWK